MAKTNCCQVTGSQVYRGVKGCILVCMAREPEGNQSPKCNSLLPGPQHNSSSRWASGSEVWQQCSSLSLSLFISALLPHFFSLTFSLIFAVFFFFVDFICKRLTQYPRDRGRSVPYHPLPCLRERERERKIPCPLPWCRFVAVRLILLPNFQL